MGQEHPWAEMWLASVAFLDKASKLRKQEEVTGSLSDQMGSSEDTGPERLRGRPPSCAGERGTGLEAGSAGRLTAHSTLSHPIPAPILSCRNHSAGLF